jgi:hypothetical protein
MNARTENILAELRAGCTYAAIGNHFGVTRQRIEQIAKKHGVKTERQWKQTIEKTNLALINREKRTEFLEKKSRIQEAVQAVDDGMHPARAAIKYQVRYQSLTNAMTNCGVRSKAPRELPRYSSLLIATVQELIDQSEMDDDEISWVTNVSYLRVRTLRRNSRCA